MVKRKRALQKSKQSARHIRKKPKVNQLCTSSEGWSEASIRGISPLMVAVPPETSDVKTDRPLTFSMGHKPIPLPPCEGPKLAPFATGDVSVTFVRLLGGNAVHSNVFEIDIRGNRYALKLFKTSGSHYFPNGDYWFDRSTRPGSRALAYHCRPFYRECRAYGRINQRRLHDRYWGAYGYLRLPPQLRSELYHVTGLPEHYWQVRPFEDREDKPTFTIAGEDQWPIYGIVKELAPYPAAAIDPQQRSIRKMRADLKLLHKNGITNSDISDRNYLAGRLFDFSLAYTLPHVWFDSTHAKYIGVFPSTFEREAEADMVAFRYTINESGIKTKVVPSFLPDDNVSWWTRERRAGLSKHWRETHPFYELGVLEPQPPRSIHSSDTSVVPSSYGSSSYHSPEPI